MRTPVGLILALILALKEGASAQCEQGLESFSVSTLQDASDLRDSLILCSGEGTYYVEWTGEINIGDLADDVDDLTDGIFIVQGGSSLNVSGSGGGGDAIINGGSRVRLFNLDGEGSQLYLNGVCLENGRHGVDGGAVHATGSSLLVATDCSFVNNSAVYRGGAIYADDSIVRLHGDTLFEDNYALAGGGIVLEGSLAEGSSDGAIHFLNNSASLEGGGAAVYRGAVLTLEGTNLVENNAARLYNGGGIYVHGADAYLSGESTLIKNSAGSRGGAVYSEFDYLPSVLIISGTSRFEDNLAISSGGAIFTDSSTSLTFEGVTYFVGNTVVNKSDGGAAFTYGDTVFGGEIHFRNNSAGGVGGAVSAAKKAIFSGEFTWYDNSAGSHGGAINIPMCEEVTFDGDFIFAHNSANESGGAIYVSTCDDITFSGALQFSHNTALDDGGAIYTQVCSGMTFEGATIEFSNNTAGDDGGAVYLHASNDINFVSDSVWSHNSVAGEGGALFLDFTEDTTFHGESTWNNNSAGGDGGALFVNKWTYYTAFDGASSWSQSNAGGKGGAIFTVEEAVCFPNGTSFENNVASSGEGDDIYPEELMISVCSGRARLGGPIGFFSRAVPFFMIAGFAITVMATTTL